MKENDVDDDGDGDENGAPETNPHSQKRLAIVVSNAIIVAFAVTASEFRNNYVRDRRRLLHREEGRDRYRS